MVMKTNSRERERVLFPLPMILPISFDFLSNRDSPSRTSLNSGLTAGNAEGLNTANIKRIQCLTSRFVI